MFFKKFLSDSFIVHSKILLSVKQIFEPGQETGFIRKNNARADQAGLS